MTLWKLVKALGPSVDSGHDGHRARRPRALVPHAESIENRLLLSVFRPDTRRLVPDTGTAPFSAIVHLSVTFPDGMEFTGTGAMVDPTHVLTAGHVVYQSDHGGGVTSITATPGQNGDTMPFGTAGAIIEQIHTYQQFTTGGDSRFDVALVSLDRPVGAETGVFNLQVEPQSFFRGGIVNTAGYPGELPGGDQMAFTSGRTVSASPLLVRHKIDTTEGDSGSPLWELRDGQRFIVAVHTLGRYARHPFNSAVRIDQGKLDDIFRWIREDNSPTVASLGQVDASPSDGLGGIGRASAVPAGALVTSGSVSAGPSTVGDMAGASSRPSERARGPRSAIRPRRAGVAPASSAILPHGLAWTGSRRGVGSSRRPLAAVAGVESA
jgi:V8-like Glu-specific endopeptidase